ncbi:MAG: hypothetical protein EB127_21310 [Alphaproteobacteria bacterium]|nr:hypothetical protein [Alphaproteobacteria bacterium]
MNIKLILLAILLLIVIFLFTGCTNAERAKMFALGSKHKITLYSGGIAVTSGVIQNEERSDGYYFMDDDSHRLIRVSGNIVIEQE